MQTCKFNRILNGDGLAFSDGYVNSNIERIYNQRVRWCCRSGAKASQRPTFLIARYSIESAEFKSDETEFRLTTGQGDSTTCCSSATAAELVEKYERIGALARSVQ
jgi:hypothetical protein